MENMQQNYGGENPNPSDQGGGSGQGLPGWIWFVLIYGVGNFILYQTPGVLLIPIPRK